MQGTHPTVIVPPAAAPVASSGCSCAVPATVSSHVKGARRSAIAIIVLHVVALLAFGWWNWAMWLASLIAWIMGGIQLCVFNKCCYITAGSLYIVGFIFDIVTVAMWAAIAQAINDANDDAWDEYDNVGLFALPPALAALAMLIGAVFSFMAVCNWQLSGAPDTAQAVPPSHIVQTTQVKNQPPPYSGTV